MSKGPLRTKKCSKCKEEKRLSLFYRHTRSLDGLDSYCKDCRSAENRKYAKENRERRTEYQRELYHRLKIRDSKKSENPGKQ